MFKKFGLTLRTIVHFTPVQSYYLLRLYLKKKILYRYKKIIQRSIHRKADRGDWQTFRMLDFGSPTLHKLLGAKKHISFNQKDNEITFSFLNVALSFKDRIDWSPRDKTFLWRYNLHYFDYAYELAVGYLLEKKTENYTLFKRLVIDWCQNNPILSNNSWDPYPSSLRIVNWMKAFHLFNDLINRDTDFKNLILQSLYLQTLFLEKNIEYHLKVNHIIENARALFLAGTFFGDKNAQRWFQRGLTILRQELRQQVAEDGGQYELSPMYHAAVMLSLLDVVIVLKSLNEPISNEIEAVLRKMIQFLEYMQMPDGEIAYLNDAAQGMTVPTQNICQAFRLLGYGKDHIPSASTPKLNALPNSGYFVMQNADGQNKCIFDCGKLGPDFQPGHGHCDTLSFVWAHQGQRVIVDSGVDDYYRSDGWRSYYRGTRAHNTIEIDGKDQSEMWANFRVGRRAQPLMIKTGENDQIIFAKGAHDGYFHLSEKVMHQRTIGLLNGEIIIIFDEILMGKRQHQIHSYLHFHPDFEIDMNWIIARGTNFDVLVFPFGNLKTVTKLKGEQNPVQGWYSPQFGKRIPNEVLILTEQLQLPSYFGYCLVPIDKSDSPINYSLKSKIKASACELELKLAKQNYMIECSSEGIFL